MSKYASIDDKIVAVIRKKPCAFCDLVGTSSIIGEANQFGGNQVDRDRLIDRRLQALRKAGRIEHRDGYWRPVRRV